VRTFDVSQSNEVRDFLKRGFDKAVKRGLLATAMHVVSDIQAVVIPSLPRPPVDKRTYAAGFRPRATDDGVEIINAVPYAPIIEYGARAKNIKPGRAMISALAEWASRKGIGREGTTPMGVAWAIATSMKKRGIFNLDADARGGLRVLERAMHRAVSMRIIEREVHREVKRELG
jgi:hypothetical protein